MNLTILSLVFLLLFSHVALSEADALRQIAGSLELDLKPGQSGTVQWGLISDDMVYPTDIQISAKGDGYEFLSFVESYTIEPSGNIMVPITVSIPVDYPGDITLNPRLYATEIGESGGATIVNVQMLKIISLDIMPNDDPNLWVDWNSMKTQEQISPEILPKEESSVQGSLTISASEPTCGKGTILVDGMCQVTQSSKGGGCLVATAVYGTEMAPQIQMLREIRDNKVMSTVSGDIFMDGFNKVYYSFSPTFADMQREYPILKEMTKIYLTPMMYTLSILEMAEKGSEVQVVTLGVTVMALNVAIYVAIPASIMVKGHARYKNSHSKFNQ